MKPHQIAFAKPQRSRRRGRGIGSGQGKTAGRGTKGQKARSGGKVKPYFEGGTNPLVHRIPKQRGFKSLRPPSQIIHTDELNRFKATQPVGLAQLKSAGLIESTKEPVKLLARGSLTKAITLEVSAASKAAQAMVESNGGRLIVKPSAIKPARPSAGNRLT